MQLDNCRTRATQVLRARPAALISDIDGTLSPIAPTPEEATLLSQCRSALRRLAQKLDLVAILSGRPVEEARRLVGLDQLLYIGNHGFERWDRVTGYEREEASYKALIATVLEAMKGKLGNMEGIRFEDKGVGVSVHYRSSPDAAAARQAILVAAKEVSKDTELAIAEGKKAIEIHPPLAADKGTAVRRLVREYELKGIVCLGDDLTDINAFRAVKELRQRGEIVGLAVGVGGAETPSELEGEADMLLPGPEAVADFLQGLSDGLSQEEAQGEPYSTTGRHVPK